jgi:DNA-binding response OmpR family regulator
MSIKKKILLGEDDKFISRAYNIALTKAGFEVTLAVDGLETLKELRDNRPDLLLLDIIMPKKNGFEVLEEMENDNNLKAIPVIVLSNLSQESDVTRCRKLGAVDYIVKSNFSMKSLITRISSFIN